MLTCCMLLQGCFVIVAHDLKTEEYCISFVFNGDFTVCLKSQDHDGQTIQVSLHPSLHLFILSIHTNCPVTAADMYAVYSGMMQANFGACKMVKGTHWLCARIQRQQRRQQRPLLPPPHANARCEGSKTKPRPLQSLRSCVCLCLRNATLTRASYIAACLFESLIQGMCMHA